MRGAERSGDGCVFSEKPCRCALWKVQMGISNSRPRSARDAPISAAIVVATAAMLNRDTTAPR